MLSYLQFDGDDHRGEVFVQLLQHDQLLQGQIEQPADKHKDGTFNSKTTLKKNHITYPDPVDWIGAYQVPS